MNRITRISFIRHGQVENPANIIYGRLPRFHLSNRGYEDAKAAAKSLEKAALSALFCSPLLRARQTAREITRLHPALPFHISNLLIEVHSAFEGQPESALTRVAGDVYAHPTDSFEQPEDVFARARKFCSRVLIRYAGSHVAAVTHGDVILFLLLWASGLPVTAASKLQLANLKPVREYPATGSITTLSFQSNAAEELPHVTYFNPENDPAETMPEW